MRWGSEVWISPLDVNAPSTGYCQNQDDTAQGTVSHVLLTGITGECSPPPPHIRAICSNSAPSPNPNQSQKHPHPENRSGEFGAMVHCSIIWNLHSLHQTCGLYVHHHPLLIPMHSLSCPPSSPLLKQHDRALPPPALTHHIYQHGYR